MELEKWVDTPDGCYAVSNTGKVKRIKPGMRATVGKVLKPQCDGRYYHVRLGLGKLGIKIRMVHSLVAEAFLGPRPKGFNVNHKDTNKLNNNISNLEYVTQKENAQHAASNELYRRGSSNHMSKLTEKNVIEIRRRISGSESNRSISKDFDVSATAIYHIKNGTNWKYLETELEGS